ncbi:beta/gamma crystallin-related protein [Hyphobacterium indicum]|uniref:beta/gamma crystallin-related protein n=1 Tax=Hyphobacterium indicum TaxID=2162714 RepID=UPI000D64CEC1|nr:beta/gamma crystallin-related protein [Hyphobacterium indicum]
MKSNTFLAAFAAAFIALAITAEAMAQQTAPLSRRAQVVLYDGPNFTGRSVRIQAGEDGSNLTNLNFNDRASSMRVLGNWEVCEHVNFDGACQRFNSDVANLGGFNDRISSVRVLATIPPPSRPTPVLLPRSGLQLYDNAGYSGQTFDAGSDVNNLSNTGFNDRTGSLVMAENETWQVCSDANYRGLCRSFSEPVADLTAVGLNNNISSMRRIGSPPIPGRPIVPPGGGLTQLSGETRGENGVGFFAIPRANGSAIDHCERSLSQTCGDTGADAVCRMAGYREASYYSILPPSQYGGTVHVGDGTQCRGRNCGAIINLLCTSD